MRLLPALLFLVACQREASRETPLCDTFDPPHNMPCWSRTASKRLTCNRIGAWTCTTESCVDPCGYKWPRVYQRTIAMAHWDIHGNWIAPDVKDWHYLVPTCAAHPERCETH